MPTPHPFRSAMCLIPMTGACWPGSSVDRSFEGENFQCKSDGFSELVRT